MEEKQMSEEFHNWLNECPNQWFRDKLEKESATYTFIKGDLEDE